MITLFIKIFLVTVSVFAIILLGFFIRRKKLVNKQVKNSLLILLINLFLPCLIFDKVALNLTIKRLGDALEPLAWGFCIVVFSFIFCYVIACLIPKIFGLINEVQKRTFSFAIGIQNYGFLALPLVVSLFPNDSIEGILLIHNAGVELAIWTIGIVILSGDLNNISWRKLCNAPCLAIMISLTYKFTHLNNYIPQEIFTSVRLLGNLAIPVGLLCAGFTIYENIGKHSFFSNLNLRKAFGGCILRLAFLPAFMFLCLILIDPSDSMKKVIIIELAMPGAIAPIYLADYYKGDVSTAFQIALSTSFIGFVSIGLWLIFSLKYFGF